MVDIWLPYKMLAIALISPSIPTWWRLQYLGISKMWMLLGLLPGLNIVLYIYLAKHADSTCQNNRIEMPAWFLVGFLLMFAAMCLYYLALFIPWLAAKS